MKKANSLIVRVVHMMVGHSHRGMSRRHRLCRHSVGMGVGVLIMVAGSNIAQHSHEIAAQAYILNGVMLDTFGYFMHGVGCIPFFSNLEPLWKSWAEAEL